MPRYYINTFGPDLCQDTEGTELPGLDDLRDLLHRALSDILKDDRRLPGPVEIWVDALNEAGERVMTAKASLAITETVA